MELRRRKNAHAKFTIRDMFFLSHESARFAPKVFCVALEIHAHAWRADSTARSSSICSRKFFRTHRLDHKLEQLLRRISQAY
ncbi:hypothetical protein [Dyella sp.]|uniref:hypothetical protein n=1 Tax=Dyella sp. TaxID=1869338 RepID=UPI002D766D40|nr:hypothetical protein [Dyella sp.]HET7331387.1 hypothetical protein [Dyella sp.]